jgi:hypothetical protein
MTRPSERFAGDGDLGACEACRAEQGNVIAGVASRVLPHHNISQFNHGLHPGGVGQEIRLGITPELASRVCGDDPDSTRDADVQFACALGPGPDGVDVGPGFKPAGIEHGRGARGDANDHIGIRDRLLC